jgi:hypothetical protein
MMNQEIKAKWVAALRSGEYKQGIEQLKDCNGNFCCLGLLCDLAEKEGIVESSPQETEEYGSGDFGYRMKGSEDSFEFETLPKAVMDWAGLDSDNPIIGDNNRATYCNDVCRMSFNKIADLVEKHF